MRKIIFGIISLVTTFSVSSQSIKMPPPSPPQTIKQDFGISSVELSYSRPGVKGRKVYGDLVPYVKVWRTGENTEATIMFVYNVTIVGARVPAGKYGLLTIPYRDDWTIIITKQLDVTIPASY